MSEKCNAEIHVRDQKELEHPRPAPPSPLTADFTKDTMGEVWEDDGQELVTAPTSLRRPQHPKTSVVSGENTVAHRRVDTLGSHYQQDQGDASVINNFKEATVVDVSDSRRFNNHKMKSDTREKAELIYINNLYREENAELQMAEELAEGKREALREENMEFRRHIRRLKKSREDTEPLKEKIRCVSAGLEERSRTAAQQKAQLAQLGEQREILRDEIGNLNADLALHKTQIKQEECKIRQMTCSLNTLQYQVELARNVFSQKNLQMKNKDMAIEELQWLLAECSSCEQACKGKLEDLMGQIAIVKNIKGMEVGEASGGFFVRTKASSLAEELPSGVVIRETRKTKVTQGCYDCVHSWLRTLRSLIIALPELVHHAGMLALGVMMPFCLMVVCLPACPGVHGPQCSELIQKAVKKLIEPYCSISYSAAPLH